MATRNIRNRVIVTIEGRDVQLTQESLGINMDSDNSEILAAVQGVIRENLADDSGEVSFTVRKATNTNNIYIYPKPVAG